LSDERKFFDGMGWSGKFFFSRSALSCFLLVIRYTPLSFVSGTKLTSLHTNSFAFGSLECKERLARDHDTNQFSLQLLASRSIFAVYEVHPGHKVLRLRALIHAERSFQELYARLMLRTTNTFANNVIILPNGKLSSAHSFHLANEALPGQIVTPIVQRSSCPSCHHHT
jgi:hypothetical protein